MQFNHTAQFLTDIFVTLINFYSLILVLRVWLRLANVDYYNPLSQFVVKLTAPIIAPLHKIFPTVKNLETASLMLIFLLGSAKFLFLALAFNDEIELQPIGALLLGALSLIKNIGVAIFYVLIASAISSWFNRGNNAIFYALYQLNEPLLHPIRRFLPTLGAIDFSPMVIMFILLFLNRFFMDLFNAYWIIAG